MSEQTILLVDDDEILRERLAIALRRRGWTVWTAADGAAALAIARAEAPGRAVVDLRLPGESGLDILRALREAVPDVEVVVLTGYGSIPTAVDAVKLGAVEYLQKPADADMVLAAFERGAAGPLSRAEPEYVPPSLARSEWEHIQRVLSDCQGNISEAARRLGLHRRTLQRKLQKYPPRT